MRERKGEREGRVKERENGRVREKGESDREKGESERESFPLPMNASKPYRYIYFKFQQTKGHFSLLESQ